MSTFTIVDGREKEARRRSCTRNGGLKSEHVVSEAVMCRLLKRLYNYGARATCTEPAAAKRHVIPLQGRQIEENMCVCVFSALVISLALSSACLLIPRLRLFSFINCGSVLATVCPPPHCICREPSVPHLQPREQAEELYLQRRLESTQQVHSLLMMTSNRAQQHILSSELHPLVSGWVFFPISSACSDCEIHNCPQGLQSALQRM